MNTHSQAVICLFHSLCRVEIHSKSKQQHRESPGYGSGETWSPFPGTALGADPKAIRSLIVRDTTGGNLFNFPPFKELSFGFFNFFFRKLFLYHSWSLFVRMEIILTHLRLFFPCSLFLLQSDETSLVSFPFGNRQIHFLIFSHAKHSKKTAHGGDQNTSLKPFLLILCFVIILFLFFLQHHGNIESKLGCQQHLKRDEQSLVSVRIHRQSYQKRGKHLSSESA